MNYQGIPSTAAGDEMTDNQTERPSLLLPTKVYTYQDEEGNGIHKSYPNAPVRWTAQPVLEWVESLVAATEEGEARHGRSQGPIALQDVQLSEKSSSLPNDIFAQLDEVARTDMHSQDWSNMTSTPRFWDLSYLHQRDPFSWTYGRQIAYLAVQVESHADFGKMRSDYQMIQGRLDFTSGRILSQCPYGTSTEDGEVRMLLNKLYEETIRKLQMLLHKTTPKEQASSETVNDPSSSPPDASSSHNSAAVVPKKDFSKYMTQWLRENWTNPYPDEEGLEEMARDCGTTPTVVSNWLINARTRKWRPAIVKATDLNRPADLLLEDSINIFDGKPVRKIDDTECHRPKRRKMSF